MGSVRDRLVPLVTLAGCLAGCFVLVFLLAAPARAHTEIVKYEPGRGEELETPPERVQLFFEGPVEAEFSPLQVYNEQGERVDEDNARIDPETPTALVVDLRDGLPAGSYTVEYRYTGVDGHVIEGSYEFSAASASSAAESEDSGSGEAGSGGMEDDGSGSNSTPVALYAVLGIGGLALGAVALVGLALRRR